MPEAGVRTLNSTLTRPEAESYEQRELHHPETARDVTVVLKPSATPKAGLDTTTTQGRLKMNGTVVLQSDPGESGFERASTIRKRSKSNQSKCQLDAIVLANDTKVKATQKNLSLNSIWDTSNTLDLEEATVDSVRRALKELFSFGLLDKIFCLEQEEMFSLAKDAPEPKNDNKKSYPPFTQRYRRKSLTLHVCARSHELPKKFFPFEQLVEDTFVHATLHTMFTKVFKGFDLGWANLHADGSFARRTNDGRQGLRPDLQLKRSGKELLY
ncbi:MAG: hypothetical protein J3Q66DRAFT_366742 [Benniella sp.]|nr:MAG: hypothetical protein J3Q66DRAFT_366742 [Benniella sp.]